jgi:toxin-antitoxin system PIN domain toxin
MTALLDANLLIALAVADHVHHDAAETWFAGHTGGFATCPITQGSLVRLLVREGQPTANALDVVTRLGAHERHEFWPDSLPYSRVGAKGVIGHRQVTDAYLAQLARSHHGRLATFDQGLAATHPDVVDIVPSR